MKYTPFGEIKCPCGEKGRYLDKGKFLCDNCWEKVIDED